MTDLMVGRINVLLANNTLDRGGSERQLVELATGLDPARFAVSVTCVLRGGPLVDELSEVGIPVSIFDVRRPREVLRLVRHLQKAAPDIVHAFLFGSNVVSAVAATVARVPIVITSRRSLGNLNEGRPYYGLLQALANRFTDLVVANAEAIREDTVRREGIDPGKVRVIRNGVNLDRLAVPYDPMATRRAILGREEPGPFVVVVANLIPYKGLTYFIDAWREVLREIPNAHAVVVGEGPGRYELEGRAADLAGSIRFIGSRDDVEPILGAADLVVQTSLSEGSPNAILEAMAAARPVVATSVGGTAEAVIHEHTGILVPPRDSVAVAAAVLRLLNDPELSREYGRAGRKRVEAEFSRPLMIRRYADLYMSLASAK